MDIYYISFYFFVNLCNLFYYLFMLYCVSNTLAPQKTQNFLIDVGWASIRLYHTAKSKSEKFLKNQFDKYFSNEIKELFSPTQNVELERSLYIKDNEETYVLTNNADMVLTFYYNMKLNDNIVPVIRSNEADSFSSSLIPNKLCSFKFINILILPDKENKKNNISIDLSKPNNYYLEGNIILDKTFIKWYCKKYHNLQINNDEYVVELFDQNAEYVYLTSEQEIILYKENYEVRKLNNNKLDINENKHNSLNVSQAFEDLKDSSLAVENTLYILDKLNDYEEGDLIESDKDSKED